MNKKEFREKKLVRDALLLKNKKPEQSLHTMFDLCRFAEKINRMKK